MILPQINEVKLTNSLKLLISCFFFNRILCFVVIFNNKSIAILNILFPVTLLQDDQLLVVFYTITRMNVDSLK